MLGGDGDGQVTYDTMAGTRRNEATMTCAANRGVGV